MTTQLSLETGSFQNLTPQTPQLSCSANLSTMSKKAPQKKKDTIVELPGGALQTRFSVGGDQSFFSPM